MKHIFAFCFLFQSYCATSQNNPLKNKTVFPAVKTILKTHGYVGGIRLDSIDAQYATIDRRLNLTLTFDYGQYKDGTEGSTVTDSNNVSLEFESFTIAGMLNFFYFNGWQLALTHRFVGDKEDTILLQKRKD